MGCASSHLLNNDDDLTKFGSSAFGHHIVSLTSTTYGLLTLDPSSTKMKTTISPTLRSIFETPEPEPEPKSEPTPEVINSWELMAGLDSTIESFRLQTIKNPVSQEKSNVDHKNPSVQERSHLDHVNPIFLKPKTRKEFSQDEFGNLCPPRGENKVVVYTTTLRGVRKTFEACNTVRTLMEGYAVAICERDISMDQGFKEELRELLKDKDIAELVPPRVFVKGRYVGGADEVVKAMEDGSLGRLLEGLPKSKCGYVCEGCGGVRFLPCFRCNGSCKMVVDWKDVSVEIRRNRAVVRCGDCNENGLVHCPICS
ncbi:putative glutaredoxin family protein [Tanacetum coccineum]